MNISLDTNILIDTPEIVFDDSREFVISFTVIRELDNLKRNPDLKRAAQTAIKNIWTQYQKDMISILNIPDLLGDSPDEKIIQDTKDNDASILSNDIAVRIIAKAHGVDISGFEVEDEIDYDYTGYQYIKVNDEYTSDLRTLKEIPKEEFEHYMNCKIKHNEYIIIDDGTDREDIWKNVKGVMKRISQKMGPYTAAGITGIQPLDAVQMCVMDAVFDPEVTLTIIDGKLGCLVGGEQLNVKIEPVYVTNKELVKFIKSKLNISTDKIRSKLKTLIKRNIISYDKKFDLTEFGPSLLIYFTLSKNESLVYVNDNKFSSKYIHFRYWLSYYEYNTTRALDQVLYLRRHKRFFEDEIVEGFTKEATYKIKQLLISGEKINLTASGKWGIDYWMMRGFTKDEAIKQISSLQTNNSKLRLEKYTSKELRKFSPRCIDYWLNKGYTETEATEKVSTVQNTFSLDKCILHYGEEDGLRIFTERQLKWQDSLSKLSEEKKLEIKFKQSRSKSSMYENWDEFKIKKGILYYIRFFNNDIEFWKTGITTKSINTRFGSKAFCKHKYNLEYEIISTEEMNMKEAFIKEQHMLKTHKNFRTVINYNGFKTTEAFTKDVL